MNIRYLEINLIPQYPKSIRKTGPAYFIKVYMYICNLNYVKARSHRPNGLIAY